MHSISDGSISDGARRAPIVVQKYGGSSVATVEKLHKVARKIIETRAKGYGVVAVVSAMGKTTNQLLALAREVGPAPSARELDMLLSAGEQISMSALSMALQEQGVDAVSLTGGQCTIYTNDQHGSASIREIRPERILRELDRGRVVVVAGFQGVTSDREVTTLGRGGSDTTAVALAAALGAEHCDIYSDVDGVYSADPRVVESARRLEELGYEEMQALARYGARVLNAEAVEFARRKEIAIFARSTFGGSASTVIRGIEQPKRDSGFGVAGVAGREDLLRVHYDASANRGPDTGAVLDALSDYDILVRDADESRIDVLVSTTNIPCERTFARTLGEEFSDYVEVVPKLGSVAAVGLGVGETPAAMDHALRALQQISIPVVTSFSSKEAVTCVVPQPLVDDSVRAIHHAFIDSHVPA